MTFKLYVVYRELWRVEAELDQTVETYKEDLYRRERVLRSSVSKVRRAAKV